MSKYKFPLICCDNNPVQLETNDKPFTLSNIKSIIESYNKRIKQHIDDRIEFTYYDKLLKTLDENNYANDETILLYIQHNNKVRLSFSFDDNLITNNAIYQKLITNRNDLFKKIFFQLYSINATSKDSISSIMSKANKMNEYDTLTISVSIDNLGELHTHRYYDTLMLSRLVFNSNSLELIEYSNIDIMIKTYFSTSRDKLNIFLDEYNKLDVFDQECFLLRHGFVSYSLGVRNFDDIDINLLTMRNKNINGFLEKLKTLDLEIDPVCLIPGNKYIVRNNYLAFLSSKYLNDTNIVNLLFNPAGHAYMYGVKIFSLKWHTLMRYFISRPKDVSEILYLNETLKTNFPVCNIPEYKYTFKQKGNTSYHVGVTIEILRKYGILENDLEKIKDPVKTFCDTIVHKSRQFVIPMKWSVPIVENLIKKYHSDDIANEFLKFIDSYDLPNTMVSLNEIKTVMGNDISFPMVLNEKIISKFELHKTYSIYAKKLFDQLVHLTKCKKTYDIKSPQDSFIKLFQSIDEKLLVKYVDCIGNLTAVEIPRIDIEIHNMDELIKSLNNWKTYYDKHFELVRDILDCLV